MNVRLVCVPHAVLYDVCDCGCTCPWQQLSHEGHHAPECPILHPGTLRAMVRSRPPGAVELLGGRLFTDVDGGGDLTIWADPGRTSLGPDPIARQCDVTPAAWQLLLEAVQSRTPGINCQET